MERKQKSKLLQIGKMAAGAVCLLLGLYFSAVGVACQYVDGVHVLGYTLLPALAILSFLAAWLFLKKPRARKPKDKRTDDGPHID